MNAWVAWCAEQHITWDSRLDVVQVTEANAEELGSELGSYAVVATAPVRAGEVLARIPCTALLCERNCALRAHMPPGPPSLCLALCVAYELGLGNASAFAPYLAMMPKPALPFSWDAESTEYLSIRGTEAERILHRQAYAFEHGYKYLGTGYVRCPANTGGVACILAKEHTCAGQGWYTHGIFCIYARLFNCIESSVRD